MVERDSKDTSLLSMPGKCNPAACTRYPVVASMATRECFNSAARNHAKVESDPKVANERGSQGPTGIVDPGKSPRAAERATELACVIWRFKSNEHTRSGRIGSAIVGSNCLLTNLVGSRGKGGGRSSQQKNKGTLHGKL
jgi:hypothetical protein